MNNPSTIPQFEATYLTSLECASCCESIVKTLCHIPNSTVSSIRFPLFPNSSFPKPLSSDTPSDETSEAGLFSIKSNIQPSKIISTVETDLGKDILLRGSANSSCVVILERVTNEETSSTSSSTSSSSTTTQSYAAYTGVQKNKVCGLARIVGIDDQVYCDLSLTDDDDNNKVEEDCELNVCEFGDLRLLNRCNSTTDLKPMGEKIISIPIPKSINKKSIFINMNEYEKNLKIWKLIGRSLIISYPNSSKKPNMIAGIIARSAGVFENNKQVCACTGKTIWEERKDALDRNIH